MTRLIILGVAVLLLVGPTAYGQKDSNDSSQCSIQKSAEGWNRYYLTGPDGDAICVDLPLTPKKFAGAKLRGGNTPVTADVYLSGAQNEIYAVLFIYDLPRKSEDMPEEQKAELFFGTWRGTIEHVRQLQEQTTGHAVEIQFAEQHKVNVMGHDARVQLFKVGSDLGQARIVFVGPKAYMLLGVWPSDRAERRSAVFFDHFEMRVKH